MKSNSWVEPPRKVLHRGSRHLQSKDIENNYPLFSFSYSVSRGAKKLSRWESGYFIQSILDNDYI